MLDIAAVLASVALLAVPGICLWTVLFPHQGRAVRWTTGTTAGIALAILMAFGLAYLRLSFFWPGWLAVAVVSVIAARARRRRSEAAQGEGMGRWLIAVLAVVAISRFAPAFVRDTPPGWDPTFHLILARKLVLADHMVWDWTPFESVSLHYPLGSHLLVALIAKLTRLPLHRVFQLLIPSLGVISTAQIYALALHVFRRAEVALYASLAYGMWAFAGSIGYYVWGGLPSQLGMLFLVAVLTMAAEASWGLRHTIAAGILLAATFVTHHHAMLVAMMTIAVAIAYFLAARSDDGRARGLALALMIAAVLASPYMLRLALRASQIGSTEVLRFNEPHSFLLMMAEMGILLVACGAAGVIASRGDDRKRAGVLLAAMSALLVAYFVCGPMYRVYSLHRWGHEYVAFTASRFLTDLGYFLSVFAGYALYRLAKWRGIKPYLVVSAGLMLALTNLAFWKDVFAREPDPERRQAYAWIEQHTPAEAIVLARDPWTSYTTWRRTPFTPLPISEPVPRDSPARATARAISHGGFWDASFVVQVVAPGGVLPRGAVLWRSPSGWSVVQLRSE